MYIGFLSIVLLSMGAQAQVSGVVRKAGKALQETSVQRNLARYNGVRGSVMGVNYYLARTALQSQAVEPISTNLAASMATAPGSSAALSVPPQRGWLEQTTRDVKAWQLRHQRRQRDYQAQQDFLQRQALQALEKDLPQLNFTRAFEAPHLEHLQTAQLPKEPLPLLERPGVLYRGMALSANGESLKNILTNGLRIADLGTHASTKLLAMSGGMRGTVSSVRPATNLTSLPADALYWAQQRLEPGKTLPVIVSVNGQTDSGKIVLYSQDIPAEQIEAVIAPLEIAGQPTWCRIELAPDGGFWVIPYEMGSAQ